MPRLRSLLPATPFIPTKSLLTRPSNGHAAFIPQIRKLVFEYCESLASSANLRSYISSNVEGIARANEHVEVVVRHRPSKPPVIRGFYLNDRDKVIPLTSLLPNQIHNKVQLLLDSSGAKLVPLKGPSKTVVSSNEAARGIWSGLHVPETYKI